MKFCANCGTQLDDGAKFCTECGQKVEKAPQRVTEVAPAVEPVEAEPVMESVATVPTMEPVAQQMPAESNALEYAKTLITAYHTNGDTPNELALQALKKEAQTLL